jgi:hypothetical protein
MDPDTSSPHTTNGDAVDAVGAAAKQRRREAAERREARQSARRDLLYALPATMRGVGDVEAASRCGCTCHPAPADPETHPGQVCSCQLSPDERRARAEGALAELAQLGQQMAASEQERRGAFDALAAELGVTLEIAGGEAPLQIVGEVGGVRFYLRARHGSYRVTVPGPSAAPGADPTDYAVAVVTVAEGGDDVLYDVEDRAAALRVAVAAVRRYLAARSCDHAGALRCCPRCGTEVVPAHLWT